VVRSDATLARETPGHVDSRFRGNDMANLRGCAGEGSGRDVPRVGEPPPTKHRAEGEDGRAKKGSAECRVTRGHSREGGNPGGASGPPLSRG
jgi:hypothetical protein